MKIAFAQLYVNENDKNTTFFSAESLIKTAEKNGCDMIFFQEMTLTGYTMDKDTTENGETVKRFADTAAKYNIAVGFGWTKKTGDKAKNNYTVLDKKGGVIAEYTKMHPFSFAGEDKYFIGGDKECRFEYGGVKFGLVICYDLRFSYIFGGNYDIMLVPADWPRSRADHWLTLLKARAIENQSYVAGINRAGAQNGNTAVFDPNGTELERLDAVQGLIYADILPERVKKVRSDFPVRQDRKIN
ncbi:MAG: carbon-nitrogen family hydrolase [Firmicutes bacterium]|nr:carbon-nitrogen family hydrolase [Bacillota bacterium]